MKKDQVLLHAFNYGMKNLLYIPITAGKLKKKC